MSMKNILLQLDDIPHAHEKILCMLLWKLGYRGDNTISITEWDLKKFTDATEKDGALLFLHGHETSIELSCMSTKQVNEISKTQGQHMRMRQL